MDSRVKVAAFDKTEINWDKLDKTKLYVVGAGLFTGVTLALYPVSVIKTRMQVASKDTAQNRALAVFRNILKADGIPGLYRGFGTVVTGAIPARIIFLTSLETTKVAAIKIMEPFNLSEPLQAAISNGMGGMAASVLAQAVFVPIDVVSQKLMVQGYSGYKTYNGGLDVARKIIKVDGIRGLYRGFGLSVMTYSPSSAIWWATYGSSQRVIWRLLGHSSEQKETVPHQWQIACVQGAGGIIAGAVASCVTTPLDTIKTRLQVMDNTQRQTAGEVVKSLIAQDGWKGLYRGLGPRFFSSSTWGTTMIVSYEYLSAMLMKVTLEHTPLEGRLQVQRQADALISPGFVSATSLVDRLEFACCCCTWAAEAFTTVSMITGSVKVLPRLFDLVSKVDLKQGGVEEAKGISSLPSTGLVSVPFMVMDNRGKRLERFQKV